VIRVPVRVRLPTVVRQLGRAAPFAPVKHGGSQVCAGWPVQHESDEDVRFHDLDNATCSRIRHIKT